MKQRHQIAARVFGMPLMVVPEVADIKVRAIWPDAVGHGASPPAQAFDQSDEAEDRRGSTRRPYRVTPTGIALLPILDTLVRRGSWIDAMSGMTSYDSIRSNLRTALADGAVSGILLDVDSPGGEAGGVMDLADEIRAATKTKPIWAIANEVACSAAYALACAADRLWIPRTGSVGSIGVIALFCDRSGQDAAEGLKYTAIYAGARKNDFNPHQPLGKDARAKLQAEVDRHYGLFVDTVARNRKISIETVRATEGDVLNPEQALEARLVDQVGTYDDALAALAERVKPRLAFGSQARADATLPTESMMTTQAEQPGAPTGDRQDNVVDLEAVRRDARAAGETEAHAYMAEVMDLCALAGQPQLAAELIKAKTPVAQVRQQLLQARAAQSQFLAGAIGTLHMPGAPAAAAAGNHGWDGAFAKAATHRFAEKR